MRQASGRAVLSSPRPVTEQNDEWSLKRGYMQLVGRLLRFDTVPTRLPLMCKPNVPRE
jgi:hypothetical protein